MLGLAEYVALNQELLQRYKTYDAMISSQLGGATKQDAIQVARGVAGVYATEQEDWLEAALHEVAENALDHYSEQLNIDLSDNVDELVKRQYSFKYYGADLDQRIALNKRKLQRRIGEIATSDYKQMDTLFSTRVPFGSQYDLDRVLFLGTAVKVEQDAAKLAADKAGIPLIRWTMSHRHAQEDICDDLANNIDKKVVEYLKENNLRDNPKGLYFAEDLPQPPHPNCQCEYSLQRGNKGTSTTVKRTLSKVLNLLRRISRKP